jgi:RNA 3'-terminal phosphate cyclase (ATP)
MKSKEMIEIDGTYGEGGGQILRTSLALSLVTGKPFAIKNIRGKRDKPGLLRQHFTAVKAAGEIGRAKVEGASVGSRSLQFAPSTLHGGEFNFAVGTAGSAMLVLQTVLPALMAADEPSTLTLEGGTHNPWAPPFDFICDAYAPSLNRLGANVSLALQRPGFYPAGGGKLHVSVLPTGSLEELRLASRGEVSKVSAQVLIAHIPESIASREARLVERELELSREQIRISTIEDSIGPGNVVSVKVESEHVTETMTGFGQKGVSAERVAKRVTNEVKHYLAADVAVGRYLADQLLIPLALNKGGQFTTVKPTRHTETNIEVIKKFLDVEITTEQLNENAWSIDVTPAKG